MAQEDSKQYALVAARAIDEKKGTDIVIQDVSKLLKVTDYFVIATGANNRRVDAIAEEVEDKLREQCGIKPISREGKDELEWVLLDYGCVVVHVFNDEARKFYSLEHLWADGEEVDLSAILPHAEEK